MRPDASDEDRKRTFQRLNVYAIVAQVGWPYDSYEYRLPRGVQVVQQNQRQQKPNHGRRNRQSQRQNQQTQAHQPAATAPAPAPNNNNRNRQRRNKIFSLLLLN